MKKKKKNEGDREQEERISILPIMLEVIFFYHRSLSHLINVTVSINFIYFYFF
jgi:hypothetical protein